MRSYLLVSILFFMVSVTDLGVHNSVGNIFPFVAYKPITRSAVRYCKRGQYNLGDYIVGNKEIPKNYIGQRVAIQVTFILVLGNLVR